MVGDCPGELTSSTYMFIKIQITIEVNSMLSSILEKLKFSLYTIKDGTISLAL